jgi:hypothetical protein
MTRNQGRKPRLELEPLEGRNLTTTFNPAGSLLSVQPAHQSATVGAASMPSTVSPYTVGCTVAFYGLSRNHNETLVRDGVHRRRARA